MYIHLSVNQNRKSESTIETAVCGTLIYNDLGFRPRNRKKVYFTKIKKTHIYDTSYYH